MATIKRKELGFPDLKQGDTYPVFQLPDETPPTAVVAGSTVLGQIRDGTNLPRLYDWGGTVVDGKVRMNAIPPQDTRRFKPGKYIAEVQVTSPSGDVTTEVHAGVITVLVDNCYAESGPALVVPGDDSGSPGTGSSLDFRTFTYIGEGPYETPFPPNGATVVLFFDIGLVPGPDLPMTLTADGFLLTDAAAPGDPGAPETVSLFYSHN